MQCSGSTSLPIIEHCVPCQFIEISSVNCINPSSNQLSSFSCYMFDHLLNQGDWLLEVRSLPSKYKYYLTYIGKCIINLWVQNGESLF